MTKVKVRHKQEWKQGQGGKSRERERQTGVFEVSAKGRIGGTNSLLLEPTAAAKAGAENRAATKLMQSIHLKAVSSSGH